MASNVPKSPNSMLEGKIEEMVNECLALRKRKLADLYEQKTAQCSLSYLIRHLLRMGKHCYPNLLNTLTTEDPNTECVLLPRTVDGRIFINGKKYDAQTYFCRLWRFPNLKTRNHLVTSLHCVNSLKYKDSKQNENMCVNPYHFSKPLIPPNNRKVASKKNSSNTNLDSKKSLHPDSPIKTIIIKNRKSLEAANKEKESLDVDNKIKYLQVETETPPELTNETNDVPTTFNIESKDHPKTLGLSMKEIVEADIHNDTELFCSDGVLKQNRLLVGLAFPELKQVDIFNLPFSASIYLPDFSVGNLKSIFERILDSLCENKMLDTKNNIELYDSYNVPDVMEEMMEIGKPHTKHSFMPVDSQQGFLGFIEERDNKKIKLEPESEVLKIEQSAIATYKPESSKNIVNDTDANPQTHVKTFPEKQVETDTYCFHCNKEFHRKDLYQHHLNLQDHLEYFSEAKKSWKCDYCAQSFENKVTWSAHFGKSGCGKKCDYCSQKFVTTYLWNVHLQRSSCGKSQKEKIKQDIYKNEDFQKCLKESYNSQGKELFQCKMCNEMFRTFQALFIHNRKIHRENPIKHISLGEQQNSIGATVVQDLPIRPKTSIIHTVGDVLNQKPYCIKIGGKDVYIKKSTGEINLLKIKQNIDRLKDDTMCNEKVKIKIEPSGESSSTKVSSAEPNPTLTHECLTCGKVFTAIGFENHQLICGGENFCELCKRKFKSQSSLFKHNTMVHKKQDPGKVIIQTFPCQYCEKKFTAKDFLMYHIEKFHPGEETIEDEELEELEEEIIEDAKYGCQSCQNCFETEQELKMHQVMTTGCSHLIDPAEHVKIEVDDDENENNVVSSLEHSTEEPEAETISDVPNVNMNFVDDEILNE